MAARPSPSPYHHDTFAQMVGADLALKLQPRHMKFINYLPPGRQAMGDEVV